MPVVNRTALVQRPASELYELVHRVEAYPGFLPWCSGATVHEDTATKQVATLQINFKGLSQSFTTENALEPTQRIQIALRDGPFSRLNGDWRFKALAADACKVEFMLDYELRSGLLAKLMGPVFGKIAQTMMDAFIREAERRGEAAPARRA